MTDTLQTARPDAATLYDLTGRVAIVTGAGTGIGAATARMLARHGADVVVASRTLEELEKQAEIIRTTTGRRCLPVQTNVKDEAQVTHLVERAMGEFGRIDILVNNAGGARLGPLEDLPSKAWDAIYDLNVRAAYICTREAGRHMIAQGSGAIVNVSSMAGVNGLRRGAHYASSKAALQMFTRVTAAEWGAHGVRANCVAVGLVASERAEEGWRVAGVDPAKSAGGSALGRVGNNDDIARVIHFLVSDAAGFVTGQTLAADGGTGLGGGG
jgi:3-oxoacyl-[acyl-carrier protein] reductase